MILRNLFMSVIHLLYYEQNFVCQITCVLYNIYQNILHDYVLLFKESKY